jgi:hypothetical protein
MPLKTREDVFLEKLSDLLKANQATGADDRSSRDGSAQDRVDPQCEQGSSHTLSSDSPSQARKITGESLTQRANA